MRSVVAKHIQREQGCKDVKEVTRKLAKRRRALAGCSTSPNVTFSQHSSLFMSAGGIPRPCPDQRTQIRLLTTDRSSKNGQPTTQTQNGPSTDSIHEKNAQRMLQAPLGTFDSQNWHEAEWTLRFFNSQRTVQSVYLVLDLLHRFLKEYCFQSQKNEKAMPLPAVLTTLSLNFTVNNWQLCAKNLATPDKLSAIPNPTNMMGAIDHFQSYYKSKSAGPVLPGQCPLQPNVGTYSMIIDALAFSQDNTKKNLRDEVATKPDCHGNIGWRFDGTPAPVLAEMLLRRLMEECEPNQSLRPTIITFNSVINTWARSRRVEAPERAEELLRTIQKLQAQSRGWERLEPTIVTYGTIIHAWANSSAKGAAQRAEALFEELENSATNELRPNAHIYIGLLKALGRSSDPLAADRAHQRLIELIRLYQQELGREEKCGSRDGVVKAIDLTPNTNCFLAVMNIYANRGNAEKATEVLGELQSLYESTGKDGSLCPDATVFNCVLRGWSRSGSREATVRAEAILQRMREMAEATGNSNLYPNVESYNLLLHTLSKTYNEDTLQRAEEILNIIEESPDLSPNLVTFNIYLHLLARSRLPNAAEKCEGILRRMWDLYSLKSLNFSPDTTSYNTCIDAWKDRSPERAEIIFRELQERFKLTGKSHLQPSRISYGSLVTAWARNNRADKAQKVFDEMLANGVLPSTAEYNATIHAWAKEGNVDQAERLLNRSLQDFLNGNTEVKPNVQSFTSVLNALSQQRSCVPWKKAKRAENILMKMEELSEVLGPEIKPNSFSFNSVLSCFSRCRKNEAAPKRAEELLRHMQQLADAGNSNVKPTVISYTTVMNCWVQSYAYEAPDRVEHLFHELSTRYAATGDNNLKPSQHTYNAIIGVYARDTKRSDSLSRAVGHFDSMMEHYTATGDEDLRPGPMHFSVILSALSRRGLAREAEIFFQRILEICRNYHVSKGTKLEITSSFNALIGAHARSGDPGSAENALKILRWMQSLGRGDYVEAPLNVYSYTSVMMAWSRVSDPVQKNVAVEKCEKLLHEMLQQASTGDRSVMPNQFTFGTLFQVIARSTLEDKKERAHNVVGIMRQFGVGLDTFVEGTLAECLA